MVSQLWAPARAFAELLREKGLRQGSYNPSCKLQQERWDFPAGWNGFLGAVSCPSIHCYPTCQGGKWTTAEPGSTECNRVCSKFGISSSCCGRHDWAAADPEGLETACGDSSWCLHAWSLFPMEMREGKSCLSVNGMFVGQHWRRGWFNIGSGSLNCQQVLVSPLHPPHCWLVTIIGAQPECCEGWAFSLTLHLSRTFSEPPWLWVRLLERGK